MGVSYVKPINLIAKRWNSNTLIVKCILRLRVALEAIKEKDQTSSLGCGIPRSDEFETMSLVLPALEEIKNASEILSSGLLTVPKVISHLYGMSATLEILKKWTNNKGVYEFLTAFEEKIEKRLPNCGLAFESLNLYQIIQNKTRKFKLMQIMFMAFFLKKFYANYF